MTVGEVGVGPSSAGRLARVRSVLRKPGPLVLLYTFYLFLATGCFLPALDRIGTGLIGKPGSDVLRNVWGFWWFKAMLLERFRFPAFTTYLNFPRGMTILVIDPLNCFLSIPLQVVFGLPTAYNLFLIAVVAFNAFAAFLFARHVSGSAPAGIVAGAIYGFAPYVLSGTIAGNSEVVNVGWIPLFFLFFHRALTRARPRDGWLAGLFLVCTTATSWYYGYIASVFSALYLVGFLVIRGVRRQPVGPSIRVLARGVLLFAIFSLVMFLLYRDILPSVHRSTVQAEYDRMTTLAGNAVNLWEVWQPAPDRWDRPSLYHLPVMVLVAWLPALALGFRRAWSWALLGVVALILAMSVKVQTYPPEWQKEMWQVFEILTSVSAAAYHLFLKLPLSGMLRFPARFIVITNLMVSVVVACGLARLFVARKKVVPVWIALALVGSWWLTRRSLTISRFHEMFAMTETACPDYVKAIAEDPDWVGVANLPTNLQGGMQLYYQTVHEKPVINYVDFVTSRLYFINEHQIPLSLSDGLYSMHLRGFDRATGRYPDKVPDWPTREKLAQEMALWKRFGLRYIVVERTLFKEESLSEFESLFSPFVEAVIRTDTVDLYRLR